MQRRTAWWAGLVLAAVAPLAAGADGDPDNGFDGDGRNWANWPGSFVHAEATAVAVQANRSVVVAGWVDHGSNNRDFAVKRFMPDGAVDAWFGGTGSVVVPFDLEPGADDRALGAFPLPDGKLLLVGTAGLSAQPFQRIGLVRLHGDGTPDEAYGPGGKRVIAQHPYPSYTHFWFRAAARAEDGRILLAGLCSGCSDGGLSDVVVVRLLADGSLDTGFGDGGYASFGRRTEDGTAPYVETALAVAADSQGRVLIAGNREVHDDPNHVVRPLVARFTAAGQLDTSFAGEGFVEMQLLGNWTATALAVDPVSDAAVVAIATEPAPSITPATLLVRFFENGTMSASFGSSGFADLSLEEGSRIDALAIRTDRRIMAAGWIDPNGGGSQDFLLARLLRTGIRDSSFDGNGLARVAFDIDINSYDRATAIALWKDQAIVAGTLWDHVGDMNHAFGALRLQSNFLFGSGFEP